MIQKLRIVDPPEVLSMTQEKGAFPNGSKWKKPQVLTAADYLFDFVRSIEKVPSGFYVVETTWIPLFLGRGSLIRD